MTPITQQNELDALCAELHQAEFVTVDTEFLREKTYWPRLCLIQVAGPDRAAAIDPLAADLDLAPFFRLLADEKVLKVLHAARQDIEIFLHDGDTIPKPIFDTQVAAMVCGFGESVAYDKLVKALVNVHVDKASRFTDWSHRPLTSKQIDYALGDVTHLRDVYMALAAQLAANGRAAWVEEEDAVLTDPGTYQQDPDTAWNRIKARGGNRKFLAILRATAAWREREAQQRDAPRNWVVRDETLLDIAAQAPTNAAELARSRGLAKSIAEGRVGRGILEAVAEGMAVPANDRPRLPARPDRPIGLGATIDLLKVLLKMQCDANGVARKLVASSDDLERLAADDTADIPALSGWRRQVFGDEAIALKHGRIALAVNGGELRCIAVDEVPTGTS